MVIGCGSAALGEDKVKQEEPHANPLRTGGKMPAQVLNIAHRGARAFAPENTLYAFAKAKIFGCPMFEADVHRSKDGELIVHHDDELLRCTDVVEMFPGRRTYFVSDFTCDELERLDAGSWYVKQLRLPAAERNCFLRGLTGEEMHKFVSSDDRAIYASGQVRLPTLRETLEFAEREGMMVNIEIKTLPRMYTGLTEAVVQLVVEMGLEDRVLISSFDHEQLLVVRRLNDAIATAVVTSDRLAKPSEYLRMLDADAYHPGCYGAQDSMGFGSVSGKLDSRSIQEARDAQRGVNVWTCNDPNEMRHLIAAGVTGLITDFPNRVRDVLAEFGFSAMRT
jgi:glycerophosphoryl diester phosphodiesterase